MLFCHRTRLQSVRYAKSYDNVGPNLPLTRSDHLIVVSANGRLFPCLTKMARKREKSNDNNNTHNNNSNVKVSSNQCSSLIPCTVVE